MEGRHRTLFEALIKRGTLTTVATLIICVVGIVATLRIPVQMIPDLDIRTVSVSTSWSGATPQDIEKEIIIEQEEYLRSIPSLQRIISRAESGRAEIELEFPFDVDLNETLIRINNALSQVPSYPENVDQPRIYASSFSANSFIFLRVSPLEGNPNQLDMDMMRDYIDDNVRARLESVPNVSRVNIGGGAEKQVQILINPAALAERSLTLTDVRTALASRNRDTSGGEIESGKRRYLLRTVGRFDDLKDLEELIVVRRGDSIIRLGDVADIRLNHFKIRALAYVNKRPIIFLSIQREAGSNVIDIKEAVMAEVEAINSTLLKPAGMILERTADDVVYVEASVANVWTNLAIGVLLASSILFLFLRSTKGTLIGLIGMPICTIAAFIGLLMFGRTINVISLAGVAFAIGMTVDNTIVVLESIELERRRGLSRLKAAAEGVRKVWPAVIASTMTTVLVFIPIVFIEEEAGQLYSDIAIAITAAILASMFVAITVVPTAAARIDFSPRRKKNTGAAPAGRRPVSAMVTWIVGNPANSLATMAVTLGLAALVVLYLVPPAEYLPEGEEPKIFARMNAPPGYNLESMARIGRDLQDDLMQYVNDDPERFKRGEVPFPAIKYVFLRIEPDGLRIISETVDAGDIEALMTVMTEKYKTYPGMRAFVSRGSIISSNDGGTRSVSLDISGPRLEDIFSVARAAYDRANEVLENARVQADPPTLTLSQPLVEIRPDWERSAELGMTASDLGFSVASLTDGAFVGYFYQDDEKIDIYFYARDPSSASVDDLPRLPIYTRQGTIVPLSAIADIRETVDTSTIRRINAKRTVTLNIIADRSVALETAVEIVERDVVGYLRNTGAVPQSISLDISGAADQLDLTREALFSNYIVAVIIIYLVLVAVFTHWGYPLLIMAAIPLGIASGIVGLALLNVVGAVLPAFGLAGFYQPFDMISMLGFLILIATVVNNPILVVDRAAYNMREHGASPPAAVIEAVETRLRPIAMTTLTTIFGLAPLVFLPGEGTELYRGVGAIVLFGILGSAVVALTFLPALTNLTFMLSERWPRKHPPAAPGRAEDAREPERV